MSERHLKFWPEHLGRHLSIPATSLWFNAEVSARRYPEKPLHIFYGRALTHGQFKAQAERLAGFLQRECDVVRGDRVAVYMQNCPQFALAYYAILRADAMVVPLSPMLSTPELEAIIDDSGARVILVAQDLYERVEPLAGEPLSSIVIACYQDYMDPQTGFFVPPAFAEERRRIAGVGVTLWSDALQRDLKPAPSRAGSNDLCVLPYTSGTTALPRGCVHRHRSAQFSAVAAAHWFQASPECVSLAVLPWFHVTGMQGSLNGTIYNGATTVILPRWDRDVAGTLIQRHRITTWSAAPTMLADFLGNPCLDRYDLSSVRCCNGGGVAMPPAIAQRLKNTCGLTFIEGYCATETLGATHINPPNRPKPHCLGIPIFDIDSRVVDPDTLQELPPGEIGEIVTHGPGLFEGYWNNPAATRDAFVEIDGKRFLRSGDLARTDAEGYFFMVDRLKRVINAAGFKVWPAEVETLLHAHPAIREAVVVAQKGPCHRESVKALVVLKPHSGSTGEDAIIEWAREHMAAYKMPRVIEFVDELPKSASGKILWRALQDREDALARLSRLGNHELKRRPRRKATGKEAASRSSLAIPMA